MSSFSKTGTASPSPPSGFVFLGRSPYHVHSPESYYTVNGVKYHVWFLASLADLAVAILSGGAPGAQFSEGSNAYLMYEECSAWLNELHPVGYAILESEKGPGFVDASLMRFDAKKVNNARPYWEGSLDPDRYARVLHLDTGKVYLVNATADTTGLAATAGSVDSTMDVFDNMLVDFISGRMEAEK